MFFINMVLISNVPPTIDNSKTKTTKIVAMPTIMTNKQFFVGVMKTEGKSCYYFYRKSPSGGKKFTKLPTQDTVIHEGNRKDATFFTYVKNWDGHGWLFNFFAPAPLRHFIQQKSVDKTFTMYAIYVPKGSIDGEINPTPPKN